MIVIDVTKSLGLMLFDTSHPKTEYGETTQRAADEGIPLWVVSVIVRQHNARRSESLSASVPSQQNPDK